MGFIVFAIWMVLSAGVGMVANSRGRNGGIWFVLSLSASPVLVILILLCLPRGEAV